MNFFQWGLNTWVNWAALKSIISNSSPLLLNNLFQAASPRLSLRTTLHCNFNYANKSENSPKILILLSKASLLRFWCKEKSARVFLVQSKNPTDEVRRRLITYIYIYIIHYSLALWNSWQIIIVGCTEVALSVDLVIINFQYSYCFS